MISVDLPTLAPTVLLELPGLAGDLPLPVHLHRAGGGLPGVHLRGHPPTPDTRHPAAHTEPGPPGVSQGRDKFGEIFTSVCFHEKKEIHVLFFFWCVFLCVRVCARACVYLFVFQNFCCQHNSRTR